MTEPRSSHVGPDVSPRWALVVLVLAVAIAALLLFAPRRPMRERLQQRQPPAVTPSGRPLPPPTGSGQVGR